MTVGPRMPGKVALVTGGASGIGAATATAFAEHGASVVATDVNDNLGHAVVDKITGNGGEAIYLRLDATDEAQWIAAVAETMAKYGRLDVLANIAGVTDRRDDNKSLIKIEDATVENWDRVFAVNSTGVFLGVKHAIAPCGRAVAARSSISRPSTASSDRLAARPIIHRKARSGPSPNRRLFNMLATKFASIRCILALSILP